MRVLILLLGVQGLFAQTTGSIAGIITDAVTRLPLVRAQVSAGEVSDTTDASGSYVLKEVPTGDAQVRVRLRGYRDLETSVAVAAGDLLRRDFEVQKLARVTGRIVDRETGEAVKRMEMVMLRPKVVRPGLPWMRPGFVNQNGEFAIEGIEPGEYTLDLLLSGGIKVEWDVTKPVRNTKAYGGFQNVPPITLAEGEDRRVDVSLVASEAWSATCEIEFPSGYPEKASISIRRLSGIVGSTQEFGPKTAGAFRLEGLQRGMQTITVTAGTGGNRAYGEATVSVSDHDLDGIRIRLVPGVNVTGRLKMLEDGAEPPSRGDPAAPVAWLVSATPPANREQLKGEPTQFRAEGIAPGAYRLELQRMPDGYAITDVLVGGASTAGGRFTLNGAAELTVLITSKPGMVTGVVRDKNQAALTGAKLRLVSLRADDPGLDRMTESGEGGAFAFRNVAPGKYRIEGGPAVEIRFGETAVADVIQ